MDLCVNTSTIGEPSSRHLKLDDKIRWAARMGFTHIEPWNDEMDAWEYEGGDLAQIRTLLDDLGLQAASVISLRGWMEHDGTAHQSALSDSRRRFAQAAAIGAPAIVASPPFAGSWHYDLDRAAERYHDLCELGREYGVRPMMEFLGFVPTIYLLEQAYAIVELAGHADGSLVLDPFHMWRGGSGFGLVANLPATMVGICHFNDAPAANPPRFEQGDADRVWPGDGCLPLVAMLRDLVSIGYAGVVSLELFNRAYWGLPIEQSLRRGMERLRAVMAEAGAL